MKKLPVKKNSENGDGRLEIRPEHALLFALSLAIVLFPWAAKPFIDTFAIGKSFARVYGFAVYLFLLAATSVIAPLMRSRIPGNIWKAQVALIALLFLYGFFGQMHLNAEMGSKADRVLTAFDQEGYSGTSFKHNHILKAIFCPFNPNSEDVDCARPIARYFPAIYIDAAMAVWLLAGILSLFAYLMLEKPSDKAAYIILSFAALRTAVDGGLLSFDLVTFCMLIAFYVAKEKRVQKSTIGLPVGVTIVTAISLLLGYVPQISQNIFSMLLVLFPICLFFESPRRFFPLLALALLAPLFLVDSEIVRNRWAPEICQNAGVDYGLYKTVNGNMYTHCEAEIDVGCGRISAGNGSVMYTGYWIKTPQLAISKALSRKCGTGVFDIDSPGMATGN